MSPVIGGNMDAKTLDEMRAGGFPTVGWHDVLVKYNPGMLDAYFAWSARSQQHTELPVKVREFIIVAIDAVVAWPSPYIDIHIHNAFDAGATIQELVEVIGTAGFLMGPHALNHGLLCLEKVIQERQADGRATPRGGG